MNQQPVQPWWPPLDPEDREEVVSNAAKHMIEVRRMAWRYMLKQTLGYWEMPPRQRLTILLDGIGRMRAEFAIDPSLQAYGPVRADVAFFEALRAIDGQEANEMLKDFVKLVERYTKQAPQATTPATEDVYA